MKPVTSIGRGRKRVLLLAALVTAQILVDRTGYGQTGAPSSGTGVAQRAASLVSALSQAMARRDREAVADMMRYPASAMVGGIAIPIGNRAAATQLYDAVFTAELRCLVDESAAAGASGARVEPGGVTIAQGRIQAVDVNGALKIARINVPPATGAALPAPSKPQRVALRTMGTTQFAGRLYGDGVDAYIVSLQKGNVMQARIEQFPGRSAAIRVVEAKSGRSINRPAPSGVEGPAAGAVAASGAAAPRFWSDTIRETGEYRIEVGPAGPVLRAVVYLSVDGHAEIGRSRRGGQLLPVIEILIVPRMVMPGSGVGPGSAVDLIVPSNVT